MNASDGRGARGGPDGAETAGLAEVIGRIREELETAQRNGADSGLQFLVERVNIEFAVQIRREGGGRGGVRVGVLTAEAGAAVARENTHRIEIELLPHDRDDRPEGPGISIGGPR
ncbi:trypco2 family protein [Streptomyces sp. NPDC001985]|uniref:trypco2 family protein n=1 Tax=Streptomyces sp. NPDC001985 TaxID=3154406 RepID=UPI003321E6B5